MINFVRSEFVFQLFLWLSFLEFYFFMCFGLLIFKVILSETLSASLFFSYFLVVQRVCYSSPLSSRTLVQNQVLQECFSIPLLPRSWGYLVSESAGDLVQILLMSLWMTTCLLRSLFFWKQLHKATRWQSS